MFNKYIISVFAFLSLLSPNLLALNGMLDTKITLPYEKVDAYDDVHVYIKNKKHHLYDNKRKTLFVDIISPTMMYVMEPKKGFDNTDTILLKAIVFPSEMSIDINVESTVVSMVINLIGKNVIYATGVKESKELIVKNSLELIEFLEIELSKNRYFLTDMINDIQFDKDYFYRDGIVNRLLEASYINSRVDIYNLKKLNRQIDSKPSYDFKIYEPLNTDLYLEE